MTRESFFKPHGGFVVGVKNLEVLRDTKEIEMTAKLYGANVCPFVHRTRLLLAEKGIEHEYVAIDLANKPDWYHEVLPSGKVPLLEHDGHRIWESDIICEYLEEAFDGPEFMPRDPGRKAEVRLLVNWGTSQLVPPFYKFLANQDRSKDGELKEQVLKVLRELNEKLGERPGPYFFAQITLADLELYPWFERMCVLRHYRDFQVPEKLSQVHAWWDAMKSRESVQKLKEEDEYFIEKYESYAVGDKVPA